MLKKIPYIFLLLFTVFFSLLAAAQNITGSITDDTNKKEIVNAVVAVLKPIDSTLYKFVRTDKEGKFTLKNIPAGKYILITTHPLYADLLDNIIVPAEGIDLKNLSFIPKSKLLQELIIKSGSPMRIKGDTTIFTADSFKVSANANVEELLKKLPGIQVDKDGKIIAMGETVQKVLVDGEEFFGDDPGMAVKNLRADAVKEVQVYDKKSDQAEFTGIDDGKTKKTINLKLKDDRKHGYFGKIDASGGLKKDIGDRYNNNILLNSFKGKRKIAGYFLNGNTGQNGLGWQDNEKFGVDNDNISATADEEGNINFQWQGGSEDEPYVDTQNGLFKNNNLGFQYSNKWNDKQSLSLSPKYNFQDYNNVKKTFTQTQIADSFFNDNAVENMHVNKSTFKLNTAFDVKLDSSNSLKLTARASTSASESQSYRTSENTGKSGETNNTSVRQLSTNSNNLLLNGNILFKHKFKKIRRTFSLTADWNSANTDGHNFLKSDNEIYRGGVVTFSQKFDQQKDYEKGTKRFVTRMVYTEPLSKNYSLELDYQVSLNNGRNNQKTYSFSPASGKYDAMVDSLTNLFDQKITVNKPGIKVSYNFKKLKYSFGTGVGLTSFNLKDNTLNKDYLRRYTNFFPAANLTYTYKSNHNFRFSYEGNTTQPRIDQLQVLRNNNDFFNQILGNPLLKPSFDNNFNLSHQSYDFITDLFLYQYLYISQTSNAIKYSRIIDASTGKTVSQPVNTNGNYHIGFNSGFGMKIKKINLNFQVSPNVNYDHSTDIINGSNNVSKNLNTGIRLNLYKSKDKKYDFSLSNNFSYNSNITQQYNTKINYNTNELDFDATVYFKKVWALKTDFNYFVRQKTPQFQNNLTNQLWNARVQRTFKKNEFTAYFSIRDILNQNTNVRRNFYGNTLSEVTNERLRRYWLVGFTWDFKNKSTATATKE